MNSSQSMSGRPQMCDFMPTSWYFSLNLMPLLHSRSDVVTSSSVLPRHETIPIPVTTTRRSPTPICTAALRDDATRGCDGRAPPRLRPRPEEANGASIERRPEEDLDRQAEGCEIAR